MNYRQEFTILKQLSIWSRIQPSLIRLSVVPDPAAGVAALRIVVRPVHHAAFRIPLVFAVKGDRITRAQRIDALGQIDVVRHQQGSARVQFDDETLMTTPLVVIGQQLDDHPLPGQLLVAEAIAEGVFKRSVGMLTGC